MNSKETEFIKVIDDHRGLLHKIACGYCKGEEDQKDVIQEIVLQLWRSFDSYNSEYKYSTWIYRVALNTCISYYRKSKRRVKEVSSAPRLLETHFENEPSENPNAQIQELYGFIHELKEIERAVILLYLDELSQKEIAKILGLSSSNVSTRINRIKGKLKKKFERKNNNYE